MDKNMMKILAVVVVAVVIVAGAAVVLTSNDDDDDSTYTGAALPVYGNADLDRNIDSDDVKIIEKIIAGDDGYSIAEYPFADANHDGFVNNSDLTIVNNIINNKDTSIWCLSYYNDGAVNVKTKVVETKWPCAGVMTTYNSVMFLLTTLGVDDKVTGSTAVGSTYLDKYMYAKILDGADALASSYDASWNSLLDVSSVSSIMLKHPGTHLVLASAYGQYDTYNEDEVEAVGCDVVRLCESNPTINETLASVLLAGFLTGSLDRASDLVDLYAKIWAKCQQVSLSSEKEGFVVATSGSTTLAGTSNQHNYKCQLAGGKSVLGSTSQAADTWILEDEYNKNIDKVILVAWSNGSNGYFFGNHELNVDNILGSYVSSDSSTPTVFQKLDAWKAKEVYVVYGDLPTVIDVLARGYAMYPEAYGDLYNESIDELLSFISGGDFAGKGLKFVYSLSELENY